MKNIFNFTPVLVLRATYTQIRLHTQISLYIGFLHWIPFKYYFILFGYIRFHSLTKNSSKIKKYVSADNGFCKILPTIR